MSNKCIYKPEGKAGEYSERACNLYNGCSNGCTYCYLKRGPMSGTLGISTPTLKKTLGGTPETAYKVFCKELSQHKDEIVGDGSGYLFFTFTSDPCLPETIDLNMLCMKTAIDEGVKVMMLTKRADFINHQAFQGLLGACDISKLAAGFTLTGRDDREPNASTNQERIDAMRRLHDDMGVYTWASIEPIVDLRSSYRIIKKTCGFCELYKIGIISGEKPGYTHQNVRDFISYVRSLVPDEKIYWKESIIKYANQK